ncbi:MAG: hypothetical protein ACT4NY_06765 [Pseudonocardiales bacterium]
MRSEAAFTLANRVAAPPVLAAGVVCLAAGALALGTGGAMLTVIVAVGGAGTRSLASLSGRAPERRTPAGLPARRLAAPAAPGRVLSAGMPRRRLPFSP